MATTIENAYAIARVLLSHGEMFHGGDELRIANEWARLGFTAEGVNAWCDAGVWDEQVAEVLYEAGMTPRDAEAVAARMAREDDADEYTSGCPIYAACNGDLNPRAIVKAWRRYQQD